MLLTIIFARLLLAVVFGVAGVAKFFDRKGTKEAALNFGAPASATPVIAIVLPLLELTVAFALLFGVTAMWGAAGALLLLLVFIALISRRLMQGQGGNCHCFGQLYSRPLGPSTLIRNVVIAMVSASLLWLTYSVTIQNIWTSISALSNRELLWAVSLIGLALAGFAPYFYSQRKKAKANLNNLGPANPIVPGLPVESSAPIFEIDGYDREPISLQSLLGRRKPVLLLFANPKCGPCAAIFHEVGSWQRDYDEKVTIAIISQGTIKDNFVNTVRNELRNVGLQGEREVADQYVAMVTPSALVVRTDGLIGSSLAAGAEEIRTLMENLVGGPLKHSHAPHFNAHQEPQVAT
ncbi:MAG TPA: MauE/DoxX family redox-associated membrane protein [Pyrinomonadaceae bacterium]|jgi:uncharacterized membrane protein YphA (DoxX/SURF4 family)|nr:MauE/DoxX family redox-associated membrane protein [Pyrinomonadaceae bacterium]